VIHHRDLVADHLDHGRDRQGRDGEIAGEPLHARVEMHETGARRDAEEQERQEGAQPAGRRHRDAAQESDPQARVHRDGLRWNWPRRGAAGMLPARRGNVDVERRAAPRRRGTP